MDATVKKWPSIFYLSFANLILIFCGMIFSILSSSGSYKISKSGIIVAFAVISIVLNLIMLFSKVKEIGNQVLSDILQWMAVILISFALSLMISGRSELMGYVWFSNLEKGNPIAVAAMNNAVYSWVCYGLALICSVVSGFFNIKKN